MTLPRTTRAALALTNLGLVAALAALGARTVRGADPGLAALDGFAPVRLALAADAGARAPLDPVTWTALDRPPPPPAAPPAPPPTAPPAPEVRLLLAGVEPGAPGRGSCILAVGGAQVALATGERLPDGRALLQVAVDGDGPSRTARVILEGPGGDQVLLVLARPAAEAP